MSVFRHEIKHEITAADAIELRSRLRVVAKPDPHGACYRIRSLYFDDLYDTALQEKVSGVNRREKFRIRYYNGDNSYIRLEKKSKINGLCQKQSVRVEKEQVQALLAGDTGWMQTAGNALLSEFRQKITQNRLRPKVIVDYTRTAFVFGPGNVRVTLDSELRTAPKPGDFLNPDCLTVPVIDVPTILEVKWDAFLPELIRDAVQLDRCRPGAFSKFANCCCYD